MTYNTSEAQRRASSKWDKANPEAKRKSGAKSNCKKYIKEFATIKDLEMLEDWISNKKEILNNA